MSRAGERNNLGRKKEAHRWPGIGMLWSGQATIPGTEVELERGRRGRKHSPGQTTEGTEIAPPVWALFLDNEELPTRLLVET